VPFLLLWMAMRRGSWLRLLPFVGLIALELCIGLVVYGKPFSLNEFNRGSWYNSKSGESLHSDLEHPDPIGPHWDYTDPNGRTGESFPMAVAPRISFVTWRSPASVNVLAQRHMEA